jgi:putative pyruvate formate lyase activating enzyme
MLNDQGLARRGLLVRHLVMPEGIAGTEQVLGFLAEEVSRDTYLNLMEQYRPCYRAGEYPELNRAPSREEYRSALAAAARHGLRRLDRRHSLMPLL